MNPPTIDVAAEPVSPASADLLPKREFWLARWITGTRLRWLWLVVAYVALQPPEKGLGIDLCFVHRNTGAPCPGCGMTRSGANMLRGKFRRAWQFHPLGYVFMPVLFAFAGLSLMPATIRGAVARTCSRQERLLRIANALVFGGFVVFGVVRFALVLAGQMEFAAAG